MARRQARIITPDAFTVSRDLLGVGLARPARRLFAIAVDGIFIAILSHIGGRMLLALGAGIMLWRAGSRQSPTAPSRALVSTALRIAGAIAMILFAIAAYRYVASRVQDESDDDAQATESTAGDDSSSVTVNLRTGDITVNQTDTLASADSVARENQQLRRQNDSLSKSVEQLQKQVESGEQGFTIKKFLNSLSDVLGFGFGWSALYFTAFTMLMRGQTPGKKLFGIRVIRLDGKPITGWVAFERFGGYAASAATGLLGFAQILWDRNRQALHDKVTETVVIRERNGVPERPFGLQPTQ